MKGIVLNENCNFKYHVTIYAIFKNEAPYLKEWIEYHKLVGVEHFYLYNNMSQDDYIDILDYYVKLGIVSIIDWPYVQAQISAYKDCIEKYRSESQWIGFIDIDEFIVPIKYNNIFDFLKQKNQYGSVLLHWKIFGSNGLKDRDINGLVTEDFIACWSKLSDVGRCFYNTRYKISKDDNLNKCLHHILWTEVDHHDIPPIDCFNNYCECDMKLEGSQVYEIQINHYVTKSLS